MLTFSMFPSVQTLTLSPHRGQGGSCISECHWLRHRGKGLFLGSQGEPMHKKGQELGKNHPLGAIIFHDLAGPDSGVLRQWILCPMNQRVGPLASWLYLPGSDVPDARSFCDFLLLGGQCSRKRHPGRGFNSPISPRTVQRAS